MKRTIRSLFIATLAIPAAPAHAQVDVADAGLSVYDLGGLLRAVDDGAESLQLFPPHGDATDAPINGRLRDSDAPSIGTLQELLVRMHDEQLRYRDADRLSPLIATIGDDRLAVRGPAELRTSVEGVLGELDTLLGHTSRLRLRWYRAGDGGFGELAEGATISAGELAQLVGGGRAQLIDDVRLDLRLGQTERRDLRQQTVTVSDFDIEIASTASAVDPVVVQTSTGTLAVARYTPSVGGGHLALVAARTDDVGNLRSSVFEVASRITAADSEGGTDTQLIPLEMQHQDTLTRGLGLSAFIPTDRVLVSRVRWSLSGTTADELLAIEVEGPRLDPVQLLGSGPGQVALVLGEAITWPDVRLRGEDGGPYIRAARWLYESGFRADVRAERSDGDFDLIPDSGRGWESLGPWLVAMPGREVDVAATRAAALALAEQPRPTGRTTVAARAGGQAVASFDLPIEDGSDCFAFVALASPRVLDVDVEVATGASIGDPNVGTVEEGCVVTLSPTLEPGGAWSLVPVIDVAVRTGPPVRAAMTVAPGGWIEQVPTTRLRVDSNLRIPGGSAVAVAPEGGLAVAVGVR